MSGLKRLLGFSIPDNLPIFEPGVSSSSLVFAAMGGGKTTCVAIPTIFSLLADKRQALIINDVKNGEIASQIGALCLAHGRKFSVVDEFEVLGADCPWRVRMNPFGSAVLAFEQSPDAFPLVVDQHAHTLIEEPANDERNFYWRESPRGMMAVGISALARQNISLATPGGLHALLSHGAYWQEALEQEAGDESSPFRAEAEGWLTFQTSNPEHYAQHHRASLTALKIFAHGKLAEAGRWPTLTHEEALREGWVICFVNPVRYADRLGPFFALHLLAILQAGLSGDGARCALILDEFCNAPLKEAVARITVFRAFGIKSVYITQSRQDVVRKYGEKETAILEENCAVKQWLKFSNFEEAERVSRAMGERLTVSRGLGLNSQQMAFSGNLSMGKERLFSAHDLMSLPEDEQIIHVAGVGFIHAKKVRQNQIAPYCFELSDNPLEGGRLAPDPKITLPTDYPSSNGERGR